MTRYETCPRRCAAWSSVVNGSEHNLRLAVIVTALVSDGGVSVFADGPAC